MTALAARILASPIGCPRRRPDRLAHDLRTSGMPREAVRAVLAADDPAVVRRYLELHREWLRERLEEQERTLDRVERALASSSAG
jgi:hypothetical protein